MQLHVYPPPPRTRKLVGFDILYSADLNHTYIHTYNIIPVDILQQTPSPTSICLDNNAALKYPYTAVVHCAIITIRILFVWDRD